ncbi:hypothetical protein [Anaerovibrio sp.]|uniref:hypothetical protein n=1 Tax=Anaerovibrio sp. TaxID=1872532 RepID=UPI003F178C0B
MATQYKKIQNKIHPKEDVKGKPDLKPKASRDALLLVLIAVTLVILVLAWNNMDGIGRGMYGALFVGMVIVYVNRRMEFSDTVRKVLIGVSSALMLASICLLGLSMYHQFFG